MFRPITHAPLLSEAALLRFCASLNSPVVHVEGLPVGPARAAVVVSAEDYGSLRLTVGLRSVAGGGEVALFAHGGAPGKLVDASSAMELALTFAEGLGFLFDEDRVARGGPEARAQALRAWEELVGPGDGARPEEERADLELLLDDVADAPDPQPESAALAEGSGAEQGVADGAPPSASPPDPAPLPLTKFRAAPAPSAGELRAGQGAEAPPAERRSGSSSELGRIPLVRRRRRASDRDTASPGFLARLLAHFGIA